MGVKTRKPGEPKGCRVAGMLNSGHSTRVDALRGKPRMDIDIRALT
jgi:hypothetical protein